ncbi:MAG: hypothetical protein HY730_08890 [Candidatus Tectomicrobia bacterium]|uniref:NTP pyrophosphohydrolase MazG putative catalytic core domain-containing protein n=1 Tax=Tectimicrobiota bacterium TaxID=2528274 RepID=A0A933LQT1_UNCTE|nr:hypothetical protein [Candidatus Tectomicrobia bacterium]
MSKTLKELISMCQDMAQAKGFPLKNYPVQLLRMHSEVSEAFQALSKLPSGSYEGTESLEAAVKYREELADLAITLLAHCGGNDIDLEGEMERKLAYNKMRPHLHGKAF